MSEFKRLEHLTLWSTPDKFWIESSKVKTTHLLQVSRDVVGGPCQVTMEPHLGQIPASANRKTIYGVLGIHTLPLGQVSWSSFPFLGFNESNTLSIENRYWWWSLGSIMPMTFVELLCGNSTLLSLSQSSKAIIRFWIYRSTNQEASGNYACHFDMHKMKHPRDMVFRVKMIHEFCFFCATADGGLLRCVSRWRSKPTGGAWLCWPRPFQHHTSTSHTTATWQTQCRGCRSMGHQPPPARRRGNGWTKDLSGTNTCSHLFWNR